MSAQPASSNVPVSPSPQRAGEPVPPAATPPAKKIWNPSAWQDAAFFLRFLRPHFNVFIPALLALGVTSGLTLMFFNLLGSLVGASLSAEPGTDLTEEATRVSLMLIAIVGAQAFIAFWRILLFAKASERALAMLRLETFSRIIRLPMDTLNQRRVGELLK